MRKSRYVTLLLAGAAATTLVACDQQHDMTQDGETLYGDVAACAKERDPAECDQGFAQAKEEHLKQAPKFTTKEECEAAGFMQCETAQVRTAEGGSQSFFMPMMMGYMMGQMLGGRGYGGGMGMPPRQDQQSTGSAGGSAAGGASGAAGANTAARTASRPVYGDRNGYLYTGGTAVARVQPGTTSLGSTPVRMTSRGGFGSSARGFSGGA